MNMNLMDTVRELVESTAVELGFEIVLLKVEKTRRIQCTIDREPGGVTINDCTALSRAISSGLERSELDPGSFHVEVMSPGVNRLLVRDKDFVRFKSCPVRVTLRQKRDGRKNFPGTLVGLDGDAVVIRLEASGEEASFPRKDVKEVRLVPKLG